MVRPLGPWEAREDLGLIIQMVLDQGIMALHPTHPTGLPNNGVIRQYRK